MSQKEESGQVIPKEITQLLERRATLEQWLGKLAELKDTVRADVHERVRADYQERLGKKESELAAHRSDMETALDERRTRVTALETDRDQKAAELEEAELRFAVGEFKESEFQKQKGKHDEALAELDAELTSDRGALEELEEVVAVLAGLGQGGGAPRWTPSARPEPEPEQLEPEAELEEPEAEAEPDAVEPEPQPVAEAESEQEEPVTTAPAADATASTDDYLDDLEFLESLSMDDIDRLDSVSAILAEEPEEGTEERRAN